MTTTTRDELTALNARRKALLLELASINERIDVLAEKALKPVVAAPAGVLVRLKGLKARADAGRMVQAAEIDEAVGDCTKLELIALAGALGVVRRVRTTPECVAAISRKVNEMPLARANIAY